MIENRHFPLYLWLLPGGTYAIGIPEVDVPASVFRDELKEKYKA